MQTGMFVDPGAAASEVLGELELQQSRMAQLAAQAGELAGVARELAGADAALLAAAGGGEVAPEVQEAEATLQVRWSLAAMGALHGRTKWDGWEPLHLVTARVHCAAASPPLLTPARPSCCCCRAALHGAVGAAGRGGGPASCIQLRGRVPAGGGGGACHTQGRGCCAARGSPARAARRAARERRGAPWGRVAACQHCAAGVQGSAGRVRGQRDITACVCSSGVACIRMSPVLTIHGTWCSKLGNETFIIARHRGAT